jgi:hypothetical protein
MVLGECEEFGEFERSAALSVWHGDIGAAVDALQRGATFIRGQQQNLKKSSKDPRMASQYAETLELVSLSVAGYRGGDKDSPSAMVWRKACANLLQRGDVSNPTGVYLRSLLNFLMTLGTENGNQEVLTNSRLSLCDRVGFACRFLGREELNKYLQRQIMSCQTSGDTEGITITGIGKEGVKILQSYVDRFADVQTAALVTSRVIFPSDWTNERAASLEWLDAYRALLNSWQMWQVSRRLAEKPKSS